MIFVSEKQDEDNIQDSFKEGEASFVLVRDNNIVTTDVEKQISSI